MTPFFSQPLSVIPKLGDQLEDFLDFRFFIGLVVTVQRIVDTRLDVMLKDVFLNFLEGTDDRSQLDKNIDTVAFIFNHLLNAPHLPFYAVQPCHL